MDSEPIAEVPGHEAAIAGVNWSIASAYAGARPAAAREPRTSKDVPHVAESGRDAIAEAVHLDDVLLPRQHFLRELQRERRRADRSKAPLSVVRFHPEDARGNAVTRIEGLVDTLRACKRESDTLGDLGNNTLAVILPETGRKAVDSFLTRVQSRAAGVKYSSTAGTYPADLFDDLVAGRHDLSRTQPLFVDHPRSRAWLYRFLKRSIDLTVAATMLLALSPLLLATAVVIASTSPGPVIYRQIRLGRGGAPFAFYKFRSMVASPDDRVHREYVIGLITAGRGEADGAAPRPWAKIKSDARITPVGRFIRKTSIDELPQLLNVLKGNLSLIGPRPPLPYEAEKYESWHLRRVLGVKPGISGLWQVEAGYNATFDDMVRLDLRYVREQSLMLDLKIMIRTVQVVLRADGAG